MPVGVPAPGLVTLTVAVKVTFWPKVEGLGDEDTEVLVEAWFTVWPPVSVPVLELKPLSPL